MKPSRLAFLTIALFACISNGLAQISTLAPPDWPLREPVPEDQGRITPQTYGTTSTVKLHIPGASLVPIDGGDKFEDGSGYFFNETLGSRLVAGVNLPSGAKIEGIDLYYNDTDPAAPEIRATLFTMEGTTGNFVNQVGTLTSAGSAGRNIASSVPLDHTVDNNNRQYMLYVFSTAVNRRVRAVTIRYKLQISPAPVTATFPNDVPTTHPFFRFVEALAASGVTSGCGPGSFCPDAPVTRGQMAVFLSAALGLHFVP